eukprot:5391943-Pyramimonas_sp.AAC.1
MRREDEEGGRRTEEGGGRREEGAGRRREEEEEEEEGGLDYFVLEPSCDDVMLCCNFHNKPSLSHVDLHDDISQYSESAFTLSNS